MLEAIIKAIMFVTKSPTNKHLMLHFLPKTAALNHFLFIIFVIL